MPSAAALSAGRRRIAASTSAAQTPAITAPAMSQSRSGALSRPPDGSANTKKTISAPVTSTAAAMSGPRTRWPVIFTPSGRANTIAVASSG